MRVAFLGNARWSVPPLEAVAASSHDVVIVGTRVPRPAGRGNRLVPTPVASAARRLGLPLVELETVKSGLAVERLARSRPHVLAVVAYGEILPQTVLDLPSVAPVNLHFSLLPELRGAAPVQWAILEGLAVTGVTTIRMDAGMDTGPILLRAEEAVDPEDDARSLGDRLAALGARLLVDTIDRLESGEVLSEPQDHPEATYAPKLKAEDRWIQWEGDAEQIARLVRALTPEPGAVTTFRGRRLKVLRARQIDAEERPEDSTASGKRAPPGSMVIASSDALAVAAGRGLVALAEVAVEGRRRISGAELVRGYHLRPGETLGEPQRDPRSGPPSGGGAKGHG